MFLFRTFRFACLSVIGDINKTENDVKKMFVTPGKVFGIAILCFFVSFAIYCCCFCTCGKTRNGGVQIRRNVEIRTELPVTTRRGVVAMLVPSATPPLAPPPPMVQIEEILPNQTTFFNENETMSKPPPTYDEVVRDDSHILSSEGMGSMAPPPTYSESIIMINGI